MAIINELIEMLETTGKLRLRQNGTLVSSNQLDIREADGKRYTVWKGAAEVTYVVDSGVSYIEEVDNGESALSPTSFTPTKSGYTFVGWREDTTASSSVLNSKIVEGESFTLYAVFEKTVHAQFISYNNTQTVSGTAYYNNGNLVQASVTAPTGASYSGWTWRGWSSYYASGANADVAFVNGDTVRVHPDNDYLEIYGLYYKTITRTFVSYNSTQKVTGTAYYNAWGTTLYPDLIAPTGASYSGWTWRGWSGAGQQAADTSADWSNGSVLNAVTWDSTHYGLYYQEVTLSYYDNSTVAKTNKGTRYYNAYGNTTNPSWTMTQATSSGWTARGWSTTNRGDASIAYANGATITLTGNLTIYGLYSRPLTLTYYNGSTTAQTKNGTNYWAPAGHIYPSWTMTQMSITDWTARGWATGTAGNASITYSNGATISISANTTIYGMYERSLTLSYYNGSTTKQTATGTRYWNSGSDAFVNPSWTMTQTGITDWSARGWATGTAGNATIVYNNGSVVTITDNTTIYGCYSRLITVTYYNNSTSPSTTSATRYWNSGSDAFVNATFTIAQASRSGWTARGWSTSSAGNAGVSYSSISNTAFNVDTTLYGLYYQTLTWTFKSYNSTQTASGTYYYNSSGNTVAASITAPSGAAYSGWTWRGWSNWTSNTGAGADVAYSNGQTFNATGSATVYGLYYQTITISYNGNGATGGSTASHTATRYYNAYGNTSNPTVTLASNGFSRSGYSFSKWASGSTSGTQYSAGGSVQLSASTTFYAIWTSNEFYWMQHTDSGEIYKSGYPTAWTDTGGYGPDCDECGYSVTGLYKLYWDCSNGHSFGYLQASASSGGHTKADIYLYQRHNGYLTANGTVIGDKTEYAPAAQVWTVDVSGGTLTLRAYMEGGNGYLIINHIRFYS